ncbi:MAG: hypothetical protein SGJ10_00345 [Bacteroidota bacterium]|nr:hypothetical protein [Bacteroidota bacterium]
MKKITHILSFAAIAFIGTALFSGCKKTDTVEPTIAFLPDASAATKGPGEIVTFTVVLNSDPDAKLDKLDITRQYGSTAATNFKSESLTGTSQNYAFVDTIPFGIATIKYSFTVTDNKSKTATKDFTITVSTPSTWGTITSTPGFIMNNAFSLDGQFWGTALTTASVDIAAAKQNAGKIDFVFGHRAAANGGAFLAAPNSADAKVIYDNTGAYKLSTWSILNKTLFKLTTLTPLQFGQCNNDSMILAQTAVGVNNDSYKTALPNQVVAFITAAGKKGLIKINTVSGSYDTKMAGQLNFDIKLADK